MTSPAAPERDLPRDREGCQFGIVNLLALLTTGAVVLAIVTSRGWTGWPQAVVAAYLFVLAAYVALRGGYFFRLLTRRTRRWQHLYARREALATEADAARRAARERRAAGDEPPPPPAV